MSLGGAWSAHRASVCQVLGPTVTKPLPTHLVCSSQRLDCRVGGLAAQRGDEVALRPHSNRGSPVSMAQGFYISWGPARV